MAPRQPEPDPVPDRAEGGPQRHGHHDDPERRPHGEDGPLEVGDGPNIGWSAPSRGRVRDEGPDHDQVVQDRREHRRREPPVRLEEPDDDRAHAVEDDLRHEPPEEEDAELDLRVTVGSVRGDEVQADDLFREHGPQGGDRDQDDRHEGDDSVGHLTGVLGAVRREARGEDRDEHRGEDAPEDQLVDDVGREVGDRVDRAQRADGDAERGRHRAEAEEPGEARERGPHRHDAGVAHQGFARVPLRTSVLRAHVCRRRNNLLDHRAMRTRPAPIVIARAIGLIAVDRTTSTVPGQLHAVGRSHEHLDLAGPGCPHLRIERDHLVRLGDPHRPLSGAEEVDPNRCQFHPHVQDTRTGVAHAEGDLARSRRERERARRDRGDRGERVCRSRRSPS